MNERRYYIRDTLIVGFAMFAIFFGAGNLIFPPYIGFQAGDGWPAALLGILLTGMLLPALAVVAVGIGGGSFEKLTKPITPWFGTVIIFTTMITIAWLITIPRTAGVAFETGIMTLIPSLNPKVGMAFFTPLYFLISIYFAIDRSQVIDKVGRILTPFLLILLVGIVILAIISPIGQPKTLGDPNPFYLGFTTGYQTGDVFTGLLFGIIFIDSIKSKGYNESTGFYRVLIGAAAITFIGLFIVYGGLEYLGATGSQLFPSDLSKSQLLSKLVARLAGNVGVYALSISVILACLTTAVGATAVMAGYIEKWSKGRISYKQGACITTVVAAIQAYGGVEYIVNIAEPVFMLFYLVGICIVLLGLLSRYFSNDGVWKGTALMAVLVGLYDSLNILCRMLDFTMPFQLQALYQTIPLSSLGFAWFLPAILGGVIGGIFWKVFKMPNVQN